MRDRLVSIVGRCHRSASSSFNSSVAIHWFVAASVESRSGSSVVSVWAVDRATWASQSTAMRCSRGIGRFGLGYVAGTATTPAYMQPKKAEMNSSPAGYTSSARSPRLEFELQPGGNHAGSPVELAKRDLGLAVAVVEKYVGGAIGLIGGLARQQFDHRLASRCHIA